MATVPRILTYEEWLRMPTVEDGREEVVNGEIIFMPPNKYTHAEVVRRLTKKLDAKIDESEGRVFSSSLSLLISRDPLTCRAPDLLVYRADGIARDEHDVLCSAPDLLVEVLSPSETKRRKQRKLDDYSRIRVPEVWIISPQAQIVEVHLLVGEKLVLGNIVAEGNLEPTRFQGVSIPIGELWPEEL